MPTNKNHFELTILGCSGGPISGKTCSFLLKPTDVDYTSIISDTSDKDDSFIAIDARTGLTAIIDILQDCSENVKSSFLLELYKKNIKSDIVDPTSNLKTSLNPISELIKTYINTQNLSIVTPFKGIDYNNIHSSNFQIAAKIINSIHAYLITHSHLDHVTSLVINSPAFTIPKEIYGLKTTMDSIKSNLFNGLVWPDLAGMGLLNLNPLENEHSLSTISKRYNITPFKVSHGLTTKNERYISTAFLINDVKTDSNILFFGDVESDCVSQCDFNKRIWNHISPLIIADKLNSMIIECSTNDQPPPLFGHMMPSNLIYEFLVLRKTCIDLINPEISKRNLTCDDDIYLQFNNQPLDGLNAIIIHVKETLGEINPRYFILEKLNSLNKRHNLKINFTIALSGIALIL